MPKHLKSRKQHRTHRESRCRWPGQFWNETDIDVAIAMFLSSIRTRPENFERSSAPRTFRCQSQIGLPTALSELFTTVLTMSYRFRAAEEPL